MYKIFIKSLCLLLLTCLLFLSPKNLQDVNAATLFADNFDRSNNNTLGSNWLLFYGNQPAGIEGNKAYIDVGAGGLWGFYKVNGLDVQDQDVKITYVHQNGDTTLLARVIDLNNRIAINYYQNSGLQIYEVSNGNYRTIPNTAPSAIVGNTYTIRARVVGNSLKVWVNNVLHADAILNVITSGSAGFGANDGYTRVLFDDFSVEDGEEITPTITPTSTPTDLPTTTPTASPIPTSTPTTSPTTTPTVTPTATPSYPVLSVPNLKQYSLPWKNRIYDSTNRTIEEFGCALTSASMVLGYHGHNILPDALNTWLKKQNDGYIRNGLINWLAVSRYTKENDSVNSPTLEYKRLEATNNNLDAELYSGRPAILKEDGHFVVATGKNENTYLINDPGYSNRNTLESYGNSFLAINSYTPTHSDLSYMMFVVDNDVNLIIKDISGNIINTPFYIEEPIKSIKNQNRKSGETVKVYLLEKPQLNKYELLLSGPRGQYQLDSYLYNKSGKVTQNEFNGRLSGNDTDKYNISFENKLKIKEEENKKDHDKWHKYFFKFFKKWW